ncbi:MAG: YaeQ family protein [Methylococcaceae bacterium]|nr:MAG: YaeQ family protein [Methylococcaceae bacterium]
MALKATIYKAELQIADMDRGYYQTHALTLALHPSETEERLMVRLLAFALHAHEDLQFTKGLSTDDEADLWQKSLTGDIDLWIDVGLPDDKRLRKACNRSRRVVLYTYGARGPATWWSQIKGKLTRFDNLTVVNLPKEATDGLTAMAARTMQLQCSIQDGQAWISDKQRNIQVEPVCWMPT